MLFKNVIETEEGSVEVEAVFNQKEVAFLMYVAVSFLMREGALPFVSEEEEVDEILPNPTEVLH